MIALVLASASTSRHVLLKAAGLGVTIDPANIDENPVKMAMAAGGRSAADTALALAIRKAVVVSPRHPGALVIGGDQILHCGGRWFDKPETTDQARAHLVALRGRRHALATAVAVVRDGMDTVAPLRECLSHDARLFRCFSRKLFSSSGRGGLLDCRRLSLGRIWCASL